MQTHMLLSFVLLCTVCILTELLYDDSADNRVITPLVGFVLTLLVCALRARVARHAGKPVARGAYFALHRMLAVHQSHARLSF